MTTTTRQTTALDRAALRRFHFGAPGAPEGGVPAGVLPVALKGLRGAGIERNGIPGFLAPEDRVPVLPGPEEPLRLLARALRERRREPRAAFVREARRLAAQAEALLESERLKGAAGRDPERLGGAIGSLGSRLVDPAALAGVLGERRGATPRDEARVRRLEEALELLRKAALEAAPLASILIHDGALSGMVAPFEAPHEPVTELPAAASIEPGPEAEEAWSVFESSDPCAVAADLFDREAERVARLLRACRRVRLEAAGDYDPARHDALLGAGGGPSALDWQAFSRDELALLPPVVVLESADRLAARGMESLSRLLLSGRPIQVVVVVEPGGSAGQESPARPLAGFRFEPAYLGLAHREAFVQQGSVFRPRQLLAGFLWAAGGTRAALHVLDRPAPAAGGLTADLAAGAAVAGRAHPLFCYDPEAGLSFAERMAFQGNPAPAEDWPEAEEGLAFTFADYALLVPALGACFLAVPSGMADDDLVSVPEWLALAPEAALEKLPAVAAVAPARGDDGATLRLIVSRPLALACRDRLGFWRTLQELAGARSEYVRRAQVRARTEAEARLAALRTDLEAVHAAALASVRREAVEEAVDRLTGALLGLDPAWLAPALDDPLAAFAGRDAEGVAAELLTLLDGNGRSGPAALEGTDR